MRRWRPRRRPPPSQSPRGRIPASSLLSVEVRRDTLVEGAPHLEGLVERENRRARVLGRPLGSGCLGGNEKDPAAERFDYVIPERRVRYHQGHYRALRLSVTGTM